MAVEAAVVILGEAAGRGELSGEQPGGERHAGDERHALLRSGRQHLLERLQAEGVHDDLDRGEMLALEADQRLLAGLDAHSPGGDALLLDQRIEHVEHAVVAIDRGRRAVQLHQVEGVHAEVLPRALHPGAQVLLGEGLRCEGVGAAGGLGGDEREGGRRADGRCTIGAEARAQRAEQALAAAVAVDVGGVEEGHARLERGVEHRRRGLVGDLAPVRADLPAALAHHGERSAQTGGSAVLHGHPRPRVPRAAPLWTALLSSVADEGGFPSTRRRVSTSVTKR